GASQIRVTAAAHASRAALANALRGITRAPRSPAGQRHWPPSPHNNRPAPGGGGGGRCGLRRPRGSPVDQVELWGRQHRAVVVGKPGVPPGRAGTGQALPPAGWSPADAVSAAPLASTRTSAAPAI